MAPFTPSDLLDNAATASQNNALHEPVTRGAILRSIVQWIDLNPDMDRDALRSALFASHEFHS